ncbi:MAG: UPF0175 family protein [Acidobacteria bacterium]|nr:UPF0175 family protein [Acidobacteriota bacterium]
MTLTVVIPDDIAGRLNEALPSDLNRRALEGLALEEFRNGRLTEPELCRMLGFETRWEMDGFLKSHGIYEEYTLEDFEQERQALKDAGL